ncbi:SGNH family hydrolase [Pseudomonas guariconensis]|uniref:SGNH/GDSL hydrolase family protein n=1 Tax=Pseudomonas guariconensis TaxID=1288410 RepID=UPI0034D47ADE
MPVSDIRQLFQAQLGAARVLYALVIATLLLCWLNQDSIKLYCQQKYHQGCELPVIGQSSAWRLGASLTLALEDARDSFVDSLRRNTQVAATPAPVVLPPTMPVVTVDLQSVAPPAKPRPAPTVQVPPAKAMLPIVAPSGTLASLATGDEVFLVGDSLMQGVAPHLANSLRKRYQIKTVNLSKQSTGLAYPGFFNWPKTVTDTLAANPNIRLMIVFMGPNDPWDMPQGKGKPFLRFKSPEWEAIYRSRIDAILEQARQHKVQVIWVGPPNMEQPRLSTAMAYLSGLYQERTALFGQHYVSANPFLGYPDEQFAYAVQTPEGQRVKVRGDDGIHFTITGQKMIAAQVLSLIAFPGLTVTGH